MKVKALRLSKLKKLAKKPWTKFTTKGVPKGCFPVDITGEAETVRYEVSIGFLSTKCFKDLLEEYEEEIGAQREGALKLPCSVQEFEVALYKDRLNARLFKNREIGIEDVKFHCMYVSA